MLGSRVRRAASIVASSLLALTALWGREAAAQTPPTTDPPSSPSIPAARGESPAKDADPPLIPPPAEPAPTSTSGTDVAPSDRRTPSAPPLVVDDPAHEELQDARIRSLQARIARDERRMRQIEDHYKFFRHLRFEGFIQPQFLVQSYNAAASPNRQADGSLPDGVSANDITARPDGSTTNGTFFRLRRTRLRTFYETDVVRFFLQLDVMPLGGPGPGIGTIVRNAEATGIARWTKDVRTEFTAGMFFTPFRTELLEPSLTRPFIERTWFIQNAFPTERDIGAHAKTFALDDRLTADVGVINGQRLGERYFVQQPDLNRSKDLVAAVNYRLGFVTLGVNGYFGRGQVVDGQQLRFKNFTKWGLNYSAVANVSWTRLGATRVSSELAIGQNLDTGVNYAFAAPRIPTNIGDDVENLDQRALYARVEQDIGRLFTAGYRYDYYSPQTSIKNNQRDTHAFLGVIRFSQNLRWMHELNWAIDNVHAFGTNAPSRHIVSYSTVLQAMF